MRIIAMSVLLLANNAVAGVWEERALLERYLEQLEALNKTLLIDAQAASDPYARIGMNYPALLKDTQEITSKIRHHLSTPLEEYRSINVEIDMKRNTNEQ